MGFRLKYGQLIIIHLQSEQSETSTVNEAASPDIVYLNSDDDEPSKNNDEARNVLIKYNSVTLYFEDMKRLFFDEMVT